MVCDCCGAGTEPKGDVMAGPVVGARRFAVYPQPPIEPLPVAAGATGEIAVSEQLAGPTVEVTFPRDRGGISYKE